MVVFLFLLPMTGSKFQEVAIFFYKNHATLKISLFS